MGIFGIFEIFTAVITLLVVLLAAIVYQILILFGNDENHISINNWWLVDLLKFIGIFYGIIFILIRGFENDGLSN